MGIVACSSADTPEDDGDDMSTGGTAGASTGGTGGVSGSATGGTSTGGTATGGGGGMTSAECKGISRGTSCTSPGLMCENLVCGLADSGTRSCNCPAVDMPLWECTNCDFSNSQFMNPPPMPIMPCPAGVAREVTCMPDLDGTVCGPLADGDYCACYLDSVDGQIWDCDSAPSTWGL